MLDVGLVEHEFKGKAHLEEELLIVAGLHPAPDRYEDPLDTYSRLWIMMNRAAVRKFIPDDVPAIPPSPSARSISSTPSDLPSSSVPRESTPVPLSHTLQHSFMARPSSRCVRPLRKVPLSKLRQRCLPLLPWLLQSKVLTPRLEPRAGIFNMSRTINRADVELLSTRSVAGVGNFILTQVSAIPTVVAVMVGKHGALLRGYEAVRREHQDTQVKLSHFQQGLVEKGGKTKETEAKLREELESLKAKLVEKEGQVIALSMENEVVKASIVQAYTRGREEGVVSGMNIYKESSEFATEVIHQGSTYYIDGFSTCLEQFKNLGNLPPDFDLSFLNMRADGFGNIEVPGPSGGNLRFLVCRAEFRAQAGVFPRRVDFFLLARIVLDPTSPLAFPHGDLFSLPFYGAWCYPLVLGV
ncbi:hypothetical protein Salat_2555000 [Sesamum alatum]|uniref:Uncharacterized protein n=1 Tax=Sesamum alatum TaxID=300844 RepID=A0AAE1XSL1_9LAMI|nr:hypothetical protein Salat_2555000 [Sesamum alatum]